MGKSGCFVPGAFASFSTPPLTHALRVAGVPTLRVTISDPVQAAGGGDPSTQATLWHVLRLAGVATPILGYGRLLRDL